MIDIKLGKLEMKASLRMCPRLCLFASPVLCPFSIYFHQKLIKKILEVSCACQMSEYHMFNALNEFFKFQNDPNRPGSIPQINASKVKHVFLHLSSK